MLRVRDEEMAAGICRALSLPVCDAHPHGTTDSNPGGSSSRPPPSAQSAADNQSVDGPGRKAVAFKSVPAVWNPEEAAKLGGGDSGSRVSREDDWVGLAGALAAAFPEMKEGAEEKETGGSKATATCDACAGFGCSWCDDGVVKAVAGEDGDGGGAEEGVWETALCPPAS